MGLCGSISSAVHTALYAKTPHSATRCNAHCNAHCNTHRNTHYSSAVHTVLYAKTPIPAATHTATHAATHTATNTALGLSIQHCMQRHRYHFGKRPIYVLRKDRRIHSINHSSRGPAMYSRTVHVTATHCNALKHTAAIATTRCNTLQRAATRCNTMGGI